MNTWRSGWHWDNVINYEVRDVEGGEHQHRGTSVRPTRGIKEANMFYLICRKIFFVPGDCSEIYRWKGLDVRATTNETIKGKTRFLRNMLAQIEKTFLPWWCGARVKIQSIWSDKSPMIYVKAYVIFRENLQFWRILNFILISNIRFITSETVCKHMF